MIKKLFILIVLFFTLAPTCHSQDTEMLVRVGISDNNFKSLLYTSADFKSDKEVEIIDISNGNIVTAIPANSIIRVRLQNDIIEVYKDDSKILASCNGPITIKPKFDSVIGIENLKRSGKPALYKGVIEIVKNSHKKDKFCIVNVLSLENYLKGVVPNEMPTSFGLEALKAQTVAARNYALKPRDKFYDEFDVCDSVASQVYFGANTEKELGNTAVKETNGLVAMYNGELILALYSSCAGGYTESYENAFSEPKNKVFPSKYIPYLIAKPDDKTTPPLNTEEEARKFYLSYPETFDNSSRFFRWEKQWVAEELEEVLKTTLIEQSKTGFVKPAVNNADEIGILKSIQVNRRGNSGKIISLNIVTDKNTFTVSKELVIRRTFKKNQSALQSANFVITTLRNENGEITNYIFNGGGYGHGVGMSQWGASSMGAEGYKFEQILQHYYSGISIGTPPVVIQNVENKNKQSQSFFAPYKKGWLIIDNFDDIYDIKIIVNNKEINIDARNNNQKLIKFDLKNYIHTGENTITYYIKPVENGRKKIKMYLEVIEAKNE